MNPLEEKEKAIWRKQKYLEIKEELVKNEAFQKFLERTYPDARERFVEEYATKKVRWIEWGETYLRWVEKEDLQWFDDATSRLKEIQQKKLFDIQCLWRAEQIEIPEIKTTMDFKAWESNIFNCPFVPPVTETEVDMYIQYLQSENFEHQQGWLQSWQDYTGIKDAYHSENAKRSFPDWYDFYNSRTGLTIYLSLPDIRGQKEEFYIKLCRKVMQQKDEENRIREAQKIAEAKQITAENTESKNTEQQRDTRPSLDYSNRGWISWFVNTYEDKETQEAFKKYGGESPFGKHDEELEASIRLICRADRVVPIQGWYDWKEAIHKAADRYSRIRIAEAMPEAYEQYITNVELGIGFPAPDDFKPYEDWYHKTILKGRELNGEPRDFDF